MNLDYFFSAVCGAKEGDFDALFEALSNLVPRTKSTTFSARLPLPISGVYNLTSTTCHYNGPVSNPAENKFK
jgi:hypothetical protein